MRNQQLTYVFLLLLGCCINSTAQEISDFYTEVSNSNYNKNLVNDYAVDNNFSTDDSSALQQAIDDINSNGGGTLYIDAGNYSFENIHLKSNVNLVIDTLAVIKPIGLGTKNYFMFSFGSQGEAIENVSIKSNDDNGVIVDNQQVLTPNVPLVPGTDIKNRYVIDISAVTNKNISVFTVNNVNNFYLSDFHVKDNYTKFSSIGMGNIKNGGLTKNNIRAELTNLATHVENAFNKAALNNNDYVNDAALVRTECFNAINTLLPLEHQSSAIGFLDVLRDKLLLKLGEVYTSTITTAEKEELIEEYEGRFQNLVIDLADRAEPEYWFGPRNGVVYNSSSAYAHYGYGLIQTQAAENVLFKDISGDGGVTLRLETGFTSMNNVQVGGVDKMFATNVYNQNGNSSLMISPHAMHNGTVDVSGVSSLSSGFALRIEAGFISKKYNQDVGLTVGTYGKVTVDNVEGVFGNTAQLKAKHDKLIPSEFNFDRNDPAVAATTNDGGESVTGPAIVTYLMSANFKCNDDGTENVTVTNINSTGFDYIGEVLLEDDALQECEPTLSSNTINETKNICSVVSNPIENKNLHIKNCENFNKISLYDLLGNQIHSQNLESDVIDLNHIKSGIYLLNFLSNSTLVTQKIVIK
ncbi:T9SS type A sorting domain-containing protein [Wenyingzhuangia sp. IMCC45533]